MPLMAYEQPLLTIVPAVKHVKLWGRVGRGQVRVARSPVPRWELSA